VDSIHPALTGCPASRLGASRGEGVCSVLQQQGFSASTYPRKGVQLSRPTAQMHEMALQWQVVLDSVGAVGADRNGPF
jgi:hypothetical protein